MEDILHPAIFTRTITIMDRSGVSHDCTTYEELVHTLEKVYDSKPSDEGRGLKYVDLLKDKYRTFPLF
jgi:hypothetical protein